LKRTYPQKIKPVQASQIDRDDSAESSKQTTIGTGRVRSLATLGLAISVGASGILLPRTGDSARASEFAPTAEPTAEIQPVSVNGPATTAQVDGFPVEPDAALANPVEVKVQQGQTLWELSQDYAVEPKALATANGIQPETVLQVGQNLTVPPAVGVASEQNAGNTAVALPEGVAEVNPEQNLNLTGSEPLESPAQSGYQSTASTPLETIPAIPQSSIVEQSTDGAIESLKKQENRTSAPGRSELAFEDGANLSTSPISLESPAPQSEASGSATQTTVPAIESIQQSLVTPSLPPAVTVLPPGGSSAPDFGANTQSNADVLYSVRPGDTVDAIAKSHNLSPKELIAVNKLGNPNFLNVNQRLKIPQVGSNNPTMQSAASISASNSTSFSSVAEVPASFNPSSSTSEIGGAGVAASAPTVPIVSPLANLEGLNNISAPMVPKINSIPLTQVSQSISDPGKLELQGEPTFTGAVNTSALPTIPGTVTAIDRTTGEYPQATNLRQLSSTQDLGSNATIALSPSNVTAAEPLARELPMGDTSAAVPATESLNPYAERLRAEIVRLRSEYRAERNSIGANSLALAPNEASLGPVATGNPSESEDLNNPYLYTPEYNQSVQNEISRPPSRAWSEQVQKQQQERFDAARAAELQPINLTPASTSTSTLEQPVVATAPLGAEGYDPLSNPSLGRMVSPELPPLSGADTYLPQGAKEQQSAKGFIWPAKGVFTSGYGWRWGRMHKGIDIAGPIGTPIVAAADGVVTYAQWNDGGYGYLVEVTHPDGSETVYAHNSRILVQKGQRVAQGEQLSEMGSTGFSTGPHLHFEIHPSGQGAVNPMAFLPDDSSSASR
jgi:murein DD-endopeptidase MepM/ murein hydrolase activator NlpD